MAKRKKKAPHVLIVEARYYDHLNDMLLAGATSAIEAAGATCDVVTVMGALEIPAVVSFALDGEEEGGTAYDGFVALGVVLRGETYHFDIVANESSRGLMDLAIEDSLAIGNGILTCENEAQALERADPTRLDKGGFAAKAALRMIELKQQFGA